MNPTRKRIFLAVNLAALAALMFWLNKHISPSEVIGQLKAIPLEGVLAALVLNIAVLGVYGIRLSLLLASGRLPALAVVTIGFGLNGILPLRLGEVAKLAYARQLFGIAAPRLIAATTAEKLMDLCALLFIGIIISQLVVAPYLNQGIAVAALLAGGIVLALIAAFLAIAWWKRSGRQTYNWITDAVQTLREQKNMARILRLASLTAIIWAITIASVYWMFSSVFPQFSLSDAGILTLVLALAIAIPSAPAGLGVVEAAIVAFLHQALQAEPNQALASALAFHFIVVIPQVLTTAVILLGAFFRQHTLKN